MWPQKIVGLSKHLDFFEARIATGGPTGFICRLSLYSQGEKKTFPLPTPYLPTKFENSEGMNYEAQEVRQCLNGGKKESEIMPLYQTQIVADIMETAIQQIANP